MRGARCFSAICSFAVLAVLGSPAAAIEFWDDRIAIHGFYGQQIRSIANNFDYRDGWDLTQWYHILNLEIEAEIVRQEVAHGQIVAELLEGLGVDPNQDLPIKQYAFHIPLEDWIDLAWFHALIDRVGKYQLSLQKVSAYSPMADSMSAFMPALPRRRPRERRPPARPQPGARGCPGGIPRGGGP